MNDERDETQRRLLNDVLLDAFSDANNGSTRQLALASFRRARFLRRVCRLSAVATVIAGLAAGILLWQSRVTKETPGDLAANAHSVKPGRTQEPGGQHSEALPTLTDEELVASFPPNTCFLAEVDGRQVLVFTDVNLQEKFVHKARPALSRQRF